MSRCVCSFLRGLWSCIMGSVRMIMFLGTLLLLPIALIQVSTLLWISRHGRIDLLPKLTMHLHIYAFCALSLLIPLLGVYGSFYRHRKSLHLFSTFSIVQALLAIAFITLVASRGSVPDYDRNFRTTLNSYQPQYMWLSADDSPVWDSLQRGARCCGIEGPQDWDPYRPSYVKPGLYPRSCCSSDYVIADIPVISKSPNSSLLDRTPPRVIFGELCQSGFIYSTGCLKRVRQIELGALFLSGFMFVIQLPLALIAFCIAGHAASANDRVAKMQTPILKDNERQTHLSNNMPPSYYPSINHVIEYDGAPPRYGLFE